MRFALTLLLASVVAASCTPSSGAPAPSDGSPFVTSPTDITSPASSPAVIRDLATALGLRENAFSYGIQPEDYDDDGWTDVLVIHHGGPKEILHNDAGTGLSVAAVLVDERHGRRDSHDCAWEDVDEDGMPDLYCTKGSQHGSVNRKWNELWIQGPPGVFVDRAAEYGVEDLLGRGRRATFLDLNHDRYPDLFVGNETLRRDGRPTPNRTFLNVDGERFREVRVGLTHEIGSECVQAVDLDGDGWDDLVLCGADRLTVFLRRHGRFVPRNGTFGVSPADAAWAHVEDLSGDGRLDIAVVKEASVQVQLGRRDGTFGPVVFHARLRAGHGLAIGDIDGRRGPDLLVVEGCVDDVNIPDLLLLNGGDGRGWTPAELPPVVGGCGDVAAAFDFDGDGWDEFFVGNGRPPPGPEQLLTMGDWQPPA